MHKYILIYIFYVGVLSCGNSNISNEHLTEGLISVHKYFLNVESISQLPRPDNLEKKIWFKDSCIILEQKVVNINTNYGDSGVQRSESYDFYKYTFMDIRTLICQDYYYFSDSAVPICNYKLKKTDDNGWIFYAINKPIETLGKLSPIPDTLINNRLYKRIKITNEEGNYEYVYYLDCSGKKNIFQLNHTIDDMFQSCQASRFDLRGELNSKLTWVFDIKVLSETLTSTERAVFAKWQKNAQNNKLPELTLNEVYKKYPPKSSNNKE